MQRVETGGGIHGLRCQVCGRGSRRGIDVWKWEATGGFLILCWMHAAQLLAFTHGWRPEGGEEGS